MSVLPARIPALLIALFMGGCASVEPVELSSPAYLTPAAKGQHDLVRLPPPKGRVAIAVYGFRDQTGQYKPAPDSSFSTAVTQGAAAMLTKALRDSGWFTPVEREGLQNLLTERRVIRAIESPQDKASAQVKLPPLMPAQVLIEGGIVAYDSNIRTGGAGVRYFGIGVSEQYRVDQVTVNLRLVDVRSGQVMNSVSVSKTVYSRQMSTGVFQFVSFRKLLESEGGYTLNEPAQLCVKEAIESGVIHLVVQGIRDGAWALKNDKDRSSPVLQSYVREESELLAAPGALASAETAQAR